MSRSELGEKMCKLRTLLLFLGLAAILYFCVVSVLLHQVSLENDTTDKEIVLAAKKKYRYWTLLVGKHVAKKKTVHWLKIQQAVQDAGISDIDERTIWILIRNRGELIMVLNQ